MKFFKKAEVINSFLITDNLTIDGNISGFAYGRIEGRVRGNVKINGKIIISESGVVEGNLKCYDLILEGKLLGDAVVHNSTTIGKNGFIKGDLTSNSISVHTNSKVNGKINKLISKSQETDNNQRSTTEKVPVQKVVDVNKKETYW